MPHDIPQYTEIMDKDGRSCYQLFGGDNVERVNPIEYYKTAKIYK